MNILIPDSWLREYLITDAAPQDIQKCLSLCGPSIERLYKYPGEQMERILDQRAQPDAGNDQAVEHVADKMPNPRSRNYDYIYDIEVTTNRVDCMGVYGIAREAAAILPQFGFKTQLKPLKSAKIPTGQIPGFTIKNNPQLCQRILAVKVSGVRTAPSPQWLQNRLIAVGLRPLNNLVDITNYVMWETGHPAHVFDYYRLTTQKMIVREAKKGENMITLDQKEHTLIGGEVVIDDGTGQIIDLPSVMGTANSVVKDSTSSVLLFVDDVINTKVRFASMSHAIRTQAATLLEKDIHPGTSSIAIFRMIYLIKQLFPKAVFSPLLDIYPQPSITHPLSLSLSQISNLIGVNLSPLQIKNILTGLGFKVSLSRSKFSVIPPDYRANDIKIPEDIIEEIARIYGYHRLPSVLMPGIIPQKSGPEKLFYWESRIKYFLKHLGFTEVYTYSLVDKDTGLKLSNPLSSDWEYLRTSLTESHQKIIQENLGRSDKLNFFEIADVYLPRKNNLPQEQLRLILSTTKPEYAEFKGVIEAIYTELGLSVPDLNIQNNQNCLFWEIPLQPLIDQATTLRTYTPISKYSPIFEDFNIPYSGNYSQIIQKIKSVSPLITAIDLIDKFNDKLTLRLTFHSPQKQLSTEDIVPIRKKLSVLFSPLL